MIIQQCIQTIAQNYNQGNTTDVSQSAWEFYIGGYRPVHKWLKDRKGRKPEFEDIQHYQKIIVALTETARLMKEIDRVKRV